MTNIKPYKHFQVIYNKDKLLIYTCSSRSLFNTDLAMANIAIMWNSEDGSFRLFKNRGSGITSPEEAQRILFNHFGLETSLGPDRVFLNEYDRSDKATFYIALKHGLDLSESC